MNRFIYVLTGILGTVVMFSGIIMGNEDMAQNGMIIVLGSQVFFKPNSEKT